MSEGRNTFALNNNASGRLIAAIGYCSFFCLIPFFLRKKHVFIAFHAKQAIVLFVLEIIAFGMHFLPVLGDLFFVFGMVVCGILSFLAIIKTLMDKCWEIPIVFDIAEKINF